MRILQVHNHYGDHAQGGEANVADAEAILLTEHGHEVMKYERTNAEIYKNGSIKDKIRAFRDVAWSKKSYLEIQEVIRNFRPDIMHVHNYWLVLTPSIFASAKKCGVPTVLTLHNYRLICPGGQFLRNNKICELCLDGSPLRAILYCCYPGGSILKSLLSVRLYLETRKRKYLSSVLDAYIALSDFGRKKFIEGGLPQEKVHVKPNFIKDPYGYTEAPLLGTGAVVIGRISPEKGLKTLLKAWHDIDYPLMVVGDGPSMDEAKQLASTNVTFTGQISHDSALRVCKESLIFLFPSDCYEGFPLSLLEAMATGRAIIASDLAPRRESISDGKTGLLFEAGNSNDLRNKVMHLINNSQLCKQLGAAARRTYLEKYTPSKNYEMLIDIYRGILGKKYV